MVTPFGRPGADYVSASTASTRARQAEQTRLAGDAGGVDNVAAFGAVRDVDRGRDWPWIPYPRVLVVAGVVRGPSYPQRRQVERARCRDPEQAGRSVSQCIWSSPELSGRQESN